MKRLSVRGGMLLVVLVALVLALIARLGGEACFYCAGPIGGAILGATAARHDRWASLTGGLIGGLCQGILVPLFLKQGYVFPDVAMMTGGLFVGNLAVHLAAGLVFGGLVTAIDWSGPRPARPKV